MAIGHVGDSRAYRLRRGKLERLTRDHSLVEEMRRKGQLTEAQAEDHPQRSIITRALGPEPEVEVDLQTVPAQAGDVFLICSDGLTTMLDDDHIERLLARATSMPNAVRALVDEANRAGGRDNISVIAFKVVDAAEPALDSGGRDADRHQRRGGGPDRDRGAPPRRRRRRPPTARGSRPRPARAGAAGSSNGWSRRSLLLIVIGAIVFGATYGLRHVWFLGTDEAGRVALYRGLPYELPFGIKLWSEKYSAPVQTECAARKTPGRGDRPRPPLARRRGQAAGRNRTRPGDQGNRQRSDGDGRMTRARNRELLALIPVALLLTAGFAAVFAQDHSKLGNLSVTYGAYFFAVCLATHVYLRIRLPNADPYLFPLMALLTAFGLVMIYRIDESLARNQANWFVFGLILFALTIQFLRDYEVLERYRYIIATAASCCCWRRGCRGSANR